MLYTGITDKEGASLPPKLVKGGDQINNRICDVCSQYNAGVNHVLRLTDDKDQLDINGHDECVTDLHKKCSEIADIHKVKLSQVLRKIKYKPPVDHG